MIMMMMVMAVAKREREDIHVDHLNIDLGWRQALGGARAWMPYSDASISFGGGGDGNGSAMDDTAELFGCFFFRFFFLLSAENPPSLDGRCGGFYERRRKNLATHQRRAFASRLAHFALPLLDRSMTVDWLQENVHGRAGDVVVGERERGRACAAVAAAAGDFTEWPRRPAGFYSVE